MTADIASVTRPRRSTLSFARVWCLPTLAVTAVAGLLSWRGWIELRAFGPVRAMHAGQVELAGPAVLGFVGVMFAVERARPARPRPVLARGHRLDVAYLIFHALLVIPVVVLVGTGFSTFLARWAPWLVLPRAAPVPHWAVLVLAVVGIDAADWLAHLANHRIGALWRLHAVHHSQEELSVLTTFRTHPLAHVTFVISAVPVLVLSRNAAMPTTLLTAYACLGALPHANVNWHYRRLQWLVVSPAYHRLHHAPAGRLDVNLGTVFSVWDVLSRRAIFPAVGAPAPDTGLAGRPVPVEQVERRPRLVRTFLAQLALPYQAVVR